MISSTTLAGLLAITRVGAVAGGWDVTGWRTEGLGAGVA